MLRNHSKANETNPANKNPLKVVFGHFLKYTTNTNAGMHKRLSRCTPMDMPMRKAMKMIHRELPGSSATRSHFRMAQKVTAVKKEDIA